MYMSQCCNGGGCRQTTLYTWVLELLESKEASDQSRRDFKGGSTYQCSNAAFTSHQDSKLHSRIAVFIGGAFVSGASRKQKCITKSPTESELVALTDNIRFIELFAEFFAFLVNEDIKAPTIYQDSTSVILLITQGGGAMRTKHLCVRMNLGKEALEKNRIIIRYLHTSKMITDGLTKVLEKKDFNMFRKLILGEEENGTA
jgi:hypothetical protein